MTDSAAFEPDWVSPPGDTIEDVIEEKGWSRAELARRTGFTPKHINELLKGRAPLKPITAGRLSRVLGSTPDFWLTREAQYRAALERSRSLKEAAADYPWLRELPVAWMKKRRWIPSRNSRGGQVLDCLEFFGVATVEAWRQRYENPLAAFRASESFDKKQGAVAAWLRKGEVEADLLECEAFNRQSFRATLSEVRRVTNEPEPNIFIPKLQELCAGSGVAVVFAPTPPGCPVSGATRWLTSSKAVLQLSLRYSSNDHLWFTFFHEAAHLLLHGKRLLNLEGIDPRDDSEEIREREANDFARDFLIPPEDAFRLAELASRPKVSKIMVRRFAAGIGLAPGIVVGRMQHEGWLEYSHMNDLKVRYRWPD